MNNDTNQWTVETAQMHLVDMARRFKAEVNFSNPSMLASEVNIVLQCLRLESRFQAKTLDKNVGLAGEAGKRGLYDVSSSFKELSRQDETTFDLGVDDYSKAILAAEFLEIEIYPDNKLPTIKI